jgi:ankyrin repeat protein
MSDVNRRHASPVQHARRAWEVGASLALVSVMLAAVFAWNYDHQRRVALNAALTAVLEREFMGPLDTAAARNLLGKGADVDARDQQERTLLMAAAERGNLPLIRELIDRRAQINARDRRGWSVLEYGTSSHKPSVIQALLAAGAEVNNQSDEGCTPLRWADNCGCWDIVGVLLQHGADPNALWKECRTTTLMRAAADGQERVVQLLLAHGADINARDEDGTTALSAARQFHHYRIARLLKQHGAID